jgi:hypothetical protein
MLGKIAAAVDEYFKYVTLLLSGNGTNGAQNNTFLDSSTNNFTITRNGNTTQGTFSPYGSNWSNYFDGSGDYLTAASNAAFDFGSGNFTVEFWINTTQTTSNATLITREWGGAPYTGGWSIQLNGNSSSAMTIYWADFSTSATFMVANTTSYRDGGWHHVAWVRNGTAFTLYIDGVASATATSSVAFGASSNQLTIGNDQTFGGGGRAYLGYISNLRIVKGTAVYTSNFTPSTSPLTAITNTSLLTCQSNRFIDNSTNAFTITRNGDVSVQRFSPFNPTAPYAAGTDGGSGYFDGTGDYLTVANNTALQLGSSDFTIDGWVYVSASSASLQIFIAKGTGAGNQASYAIGLDGSQFIYYLSGNGSSWNIASGVSMGSVNLNSWNYVALVRSGNTFTPYINGVAGTTTTSSSALFAGTAVLSIGSSDTGDQRLTGYVCGARVIKGTALTITVPTAPTTAVTNTQLLCNFTNAGILDNAEMNNLETVGNAQISTAQSKFGGSSMYFDGSGDWLTVPYSQNINFGTGNFTIEGWLYLSSFANAYYVLGGTWTTGTTDEWLVQIENNGNMRFLTSAGTSFYTAGITTGAWYHFAAVRNGSTVTLYVNGSSVGSYTNSNSIGSTSKTLYIGVQNNGAAWPWNGYIDDLRITKGVARYTSSFTAPTAPFPLS